MYRSRTRSRVLLNNADDQSGAVTQHSLLIAQHLFQNGFRLKKSCVFLFLLALVAYQSCVFSRSQRYENFTVRTPIQKSDYLILGILGGREKWNSEREGVRKLALRLRSHNLPHLRVETLENTKRSLAVQLILKAFDFNRSGSLEAEEREQARLIIYGQSFGGAAVVKLARQLKDLKIPIRLTVQIDSVGRHDHVIPSNVRQAANLFQKDGWPIRGEPVIRPEDSSRTKIIGNFQYHYKEKQISLAGVPWWKKIFRRAHSKMNRDPEVWEKVEELILHEVHNADVDPALRPN